MYGGSTPWGYIQKKNELTKLEDNLRSFKIAHSKWLEEGKKLLLILQQEMGKDQPDLNAVKKLVDQIEKHLRQSAVILKASFS